MTRTEGIFHLGPSALTGYENLRRMLALSALFHAAVILFAVLLSIFSATVRLTPKAYQVDLVKLPAPAPATVETKEAPPPAKPDPPPEKKPKAPEPLPVEVKKSSRPAPPPKPVKPAAVVPPNAKPAPTEKTAPDTTTSKTAESAAIAPPEVHIQAGIEAPNFKFPYYLDLIQRKIGIHWSPPPLEAIRDEREAVVSFMLQADGKINNVTIRKSSGNAFFDQAALRAVYQANPLPPFPQGIPEDSLRVNFSFSLLKKG